MHLKESDNASLVQKLLIKYTKVTSQRFPWEGYRILPNRTKKSGIFEITGLPFAGKTSALHFAREYFSTLPNNVVFNIWPEFNGYKDEYQKARDHRYFNMEYSPFIRFCNDLKLASFKKGRELHTILANKEGACTTLIERGLCDIMACEWIAQKTSNKNYKKDIAISLNSILKRFSEIDAVILYGVSYETVKARRKAQGRNEEGYFTNSQIWPGLEDGYSWWLGHVYPLMYEHFGTGLLVINGDNDLDDNNKKVVDFIATLQL